jgi:hypothetical protein
MSPPASSDRTRRASRGLLSCATLALFTQLLPSCGKSDPAPEATPAAPATANAATATATAGAAASPLSGGAEAAAAGKGIQVAIKDLQLFHPYSAKRTMQPIRDDGNFSTRDSKPYYGLGILLEVTNDTGQILNNASFEGALRFVSGSGESVCYFDADNIAPGYGFALFLSYAPKPPGKEVVDPFLGPQSNWKDEDGSMAESVWRPGERIRMAARADCESLLLADIGATELKGSLTIKSYRRLIDWRRGRLDDRNYDLALAGDRVRVKDKHSGRISLIDVAHVYELVASGDAPPDGRPIPLSKVRYNTEKAYVGPSEADRVESAPVEFTLSPRALSLQLVKLPTGEFAHASGNVVVFTKDGKVTYEDLGKLKVSMLDAERKDLPATPPDVSFEADELSGRVTGMAIVPFTEDEGIPKGERRLRVTWKLGVKGGDIEGRLKAAVDTASQELEKATRAAEAVSIDTTADAAAEAAAKAAVTKAKAAKTAAETKFKTSLSGERGRLTKLLSCGEVKLATNKGVRAPVNAKAASDACKGLEKSDEVEVTMTYALDRYELPVALVYAVGKTNSFTAIASDSLAKLDPR